MNLIAVEEADEGSQAFTEDMFTEEGSFCDEVKENSGCCPACGYKWHVDKCVTEEPATTPYCKQLKEPKHSGCCVFCGNVWSAEKGMCVKG